jgi:hypothetical protein
MIRLIFVYNADSDFSSVVEDFWGKLTNSGQVKCKLCELTYGTWAMKEEWKLFLGTLGVETKFMHKDEFVTKLGRDYIDFPAVFIKKDKGVRVLVTAAEINKVRDLQDLMDLIEFKLKG